MIEVGQRLPEVLGIDQDGKEWKIIRYFFMLDRKSNV